MSNTAIEILFAESNKEEVTARLSLLSKHLEGAYVEHKGTTIKFPISIHYGIAIFPKDGDSIYKLRDVAQKNLNK